MPQSLSSNRKVPVPQNSQKTEAIAENTPEHKSLFATLWHFQMLY